MEQVWTGAENLALTGIRSPDRPAPTELLYRLRYSSPPFQPSARWKYSPITLTLEVRRATPRNLHFTVAVPSKWRTLLVMWCTNVSPVTRLEFICMLFIWHIQSYHCSAKDKRWSVAGGDYCLKATAFESKGAFTQKRGKATRAGVYPLPNNDEVMNEKRHASIPLFPWNTCYARGHLFHLR
jgi:hypothetical protein